VLGALELMGRKYKCEKAVMARTGITRQSGGCLCFVSRMADGGCTLIKVSESSSNSASRKAAEPAEKVKGDLTGRKGIQGIGLKTKTLPLI